MPTLQVIISLVAALSSETSVTLKLYVHDKALAGAAAGLAGETVVTIAPGSMGPINALVSVDPDAQQAGRTASQMVYPAHYLSVLSDQVMTTQVPEYGDGAPYFNLDITQPLNVKLKPR
eukprot:RCo045598